MRELCVASLHRTRARARKQIRPEIQSAQHPKQNPPVRAAVERQMRGRREQRRQFISGLRSMADFYEEHGDAYYDGTSLLLSMYVNSGNARSVLQSMARAFGEYEEVYDEMHAAVARRFGEKVKLELFAPRAKVCRAASVGARMEQALILPAVSEVRIPERVIEVVEWDGSPLLSGTDASILLP